MNIVTVGIDLAKNVSALHRTLAENGGSPCSCRERPLGGRWVWDCKERFSEVNRMAWARRRTDVVWVLPKANSRKLDQIFAPVLSCNI